ncbi:UTP--glucose-1-phosphate uridylyltransferase [Schlesneria paludicola]|uniref:UTP--glucose-1-phosphate uridylyltransferase n=1 Tax=Schlesneria paludicola TaxID=360056 RepID=UPI00029AADE7|nr:UDPGP type 1 family protein [Schlesneria paludicola]
MQIDPKTQSQIENHGQAHIRTMWEELDHHEKEKLNRQLAQVDWKLIGSYRAGLQGATEKGAPDAVKISPPSHVVRLPNSPSDQKAWKEAEAIGDDALKSGKVGVVLLAGGQGTRLGFPHPKGMFPIGPVSSKTLFEIFAEQIIAISQKSGHAIPYMIMTSDGTHDETTQFFEQNNYFGLDRADVFFFKQGYAPCLDATTGELLLAEKGVLAMSPDGHGGLLAAMLNAGLFDELRQRKVDYVFLHQIDNPLVSVCNPGFLGMHIHHRAQASTKVVAKTGPEEKVGVAVDLDGRTAIIEYSDLSSELANQRESNGELRYWAGSTAIHVFDRAFLESVAQSENANLPWHLARKKIPHIDHQGQQILPESENGVKFERFLFDTLPLAKTALIVETSRPLEFAPLKNSSGAFSPDYVREHMVNVAIEWLKQAGVIVPESAIVEISPLFANTPEDLKKRASELANLDFSQPIYLHKDR